MVWKKATSKIPPVLTPPSAHYLSNILSQINNFYNLSRAKVNTPSLVFFFYALKAKHRLLTTLASCSAAAQHPGSTGCFCRQTCAPLRSVGTGIARARTGAASTAETAESHSAALDTSEDPINTPHTRMRNEPTVSQQSRAGSSPLNPQRLA